MPTSCIEQRDEEDEIELAVEVGVGFLFELQSWFPAARSSKCACVRISKL